MSIAVAAVDSAAEAIPTRRMSVGEFWAFVHRPENAERSFELIRGEVIEMPPASRKHGAVAGNISRILGNWTFQTGCGYVATNDTGVVLNESEEVVLGPDLALYTDATQFDDVPEKWGETLPVLVVEVLSPSDRTTQVNRKVSEYLQAGVKVVLLVDPEERAVTVYRPEHTLQLLRETDAISGGDELPGFSCRVADFFLLPGTPPKANA